MMYYITQFIKHANAVEFIANVILNSIISDISSHIGIRKGKVVPVLH
jgi:pheromone shutdown protein TraB